MAPPPQSSLPSPTPLSADPGLGPAAWGQAQDVWRCQGFLKREVSLVHFTSKTPALSSIWEPCARTERPLSSPYLTPPG